MMVVLANPSTCLLLSFEYQGGASKSDTVGYDRPFHVEGVDTHWIDRLRFSPPLEGAGQKNAQADENQQGKQRQHANHERIHTAVRR